MQIKFHNECKTEVPTASLIELYQLLIYAIENQKWDDVSCVAECLEEDIASNSTTSSCMNFKPTCTSLVAPFHEAGIITDEDGNDLRCAAGFFVSELANCNESCCPYVAGLCSPDRGLILLEGGVQYKMGILDDNLLRNLRKI